MRVGVIDIGSNSTRMLLADVRGRAVVPLEADMATTRLGRGIAGGLLDRYAMEKTAAVVQAFRERLDAAGAEKAVVAATAAVREAKNAGEFVGLVRRRTGDTVLVLSGEEEASFGYLGVTAGLPGMEGKAVTMDIGGGSTEFAWPNSDGLRHVSLPAGAVRMTERDYTDGEILDILSGVTGALKERPELQLVGIGGTMTTLAAVAQGLKVYDPRLVHGYVLTRAKIAEILDDLRARTVEERRRMPGLQPERADIIVAGVRICLLAMGAMAKTTVTVSDYDILHGLALRVAGS
ncbi:Ppx/GppA family phosphatase [Desulforudis sp. 1088]|uniref:Ppx/GppA phosphatase family protein n=1 Tax=unclassified Candidatus Desulforudis TaxID=2635950 RepID=UPI003CE4B896